ncbi:hypothetical protein HL657_11780 [Methanoculleus sp. YWC-01]|jgi:mRNA-degrading endonuclease RelE of RelBE toxin-antitoxin system|uniref:Plasmid stabilization system n=1 Tax=Methanoculleus nereidis TaxID=2735141 RepID=A0ABU3Z4U2_9EURY|nr:hypothetical protein [Methanoculleus sp. YWC-01]MDV4343835.1 hypothetical protein [Methanoculleus sp. YWC-01]
MEWTIRRTDTFVESLSKVKDNKEVIIELGKKLQRLKQDPLNTGGWLSGALHGKNATRIAKRYRLIFLPDERERTVYLIAVDHRRHVYRLR